MCGSLGGDKSARQTLRSWWALLEFEGWFYNERHQGGEKGECVGDRSSRGGGTGTAKPVSKEVVSDREI